VSVARSFEENLFDGESALSQGIPSARRSIEKACGKQFDPRIVEAFLRVPERTWADLMSEIDRRT
jgi:response regulator RpfG family c-di-GMP phosphodiesterase